MMAKQISVYTNSQGEKIEIALAGDGTRFAGIPVLLIHDDPDQSDCIAPHLLDKGTIDWLLAQLTTLLEPEALAQGMNDGRQQKLSRIV